MKRLAGCMMIVGLSLCPFAADAQFNVIGDALKRIIMAIDLRVQRAQTETIGLQSAAKRLENLMQQTRLGEIADWVRQQKELYDAYYKELWQVKRALRYYSAVRELVEKAGRMIDGYRQAAAAISGDRHFSVEEKQSMLSVYDGMLRHSADLVSELETVVASLVTQMDDADRLRIIDELSSAMDRQYRALQAFTQENLLISLQRGRSLQDIHFLKLLYGL